MEHSVLLHSSGEAITRTNDKHHLLFARVAFIVGDSSDSEGVGLDWSEGRQGKEHMGTGAPAERNMSTDSEADSVVVDELNLGLVGRVGGRLEVGEDEVADVSADAVEAPDDEAWPDVVAEALYDTKE